MIVTGVERKRHSVLLCVCEIELVRADGAALRADTEHLALYRVDGVLAVDLFREYLVIGLHETLTEGVAVYGDILHSVGYPMVIHNGSAELLTDILGDAATSLAVVYPKAADARIGMRKGEAVGAVLMRKICGVKVDTEAVFLSPLYP